MISKVRKILFPLSSPLPAMGKRGRKMIINHKIEKKMMIIITTIKKFSLSRPLSQSIFKAVCTSWGFNILVYVIPNFGFRTMIFKFPSFIYIGSTKLSTDLLALIVLTFQNLKQNTFHHLWKSCLYHIYDILRWHI